MSEEHKENRDDKKDKPVWKNRRRVIFGSLIFCAATVAFVLWKGEDTRIGETAITMAFIMASSVVGGYVFGASWENIGISKK